MAASIRECERRVPVGTRGRKTRGKTGTRFCARIPAEDRRGRRIGFPFPPLYTGPMETDRFVSDISLPGMLHAVVLRSAVAKGRLVSVEAAGLPAGCVLIAAKDIPGTNALVDSSLPILASDELSYIGEPVALLVGPDLDVLERSLPLCGISVLEERPVFSCGAAEERIESPPSPVAARREFRTGDPDAAFGGAETVLHGEYSTGIQEHWYGEPCGALARQEAEPEDSPEGGREPLVVSTATQWPAHVAGSVAGMLDLPPDAVRVRPTALDAHLDGKLLYPSLLACHAALGAAITGKPVRLVPSRREDFAFSPKRFGSRIGISCALDAGGRLLGLNVRARLNVGAHGIGAEELLDQLCLGSIGAYACKNVRFSGTAFRTNLPPQGAFAGFGLAQGLFAMERHISLLTDRLSLDPLQWRKENAAKPGMLSLGLPTGTVICPQALADTAARSGDFHRKRAAYELLRLKRREGTAPEEGEFRGLPRGIGLAVGFQGNRPLHPKVPGGGYSVRLVIEKDGILRIWTGMPGIRRELLADIACEVLGMESAQVHVDGPPAEGEAPPEPGSLSSGPRTMSAGVSVVARLVEEACLAIREQRFRNPLPIGVERSSSPTIRDEWDRFFRLSGESCDSGGFTDAGSAAAVVEVEMDAVRHLPRIRGVWLAVDGGRIYREKEARGNLTAGVLHALAWAAGERVGYVLGRIPSGDFHDFGLRGAADMPPVTIEFVGDPAEGPKGIGDLPYACVPAAFLQAVSQACDRHFENIPLRPEDIWYAEVNRRKEATE